MLGFRDMIRLVLTTIIAVLISFGAISKNNQASVLLNHVTEEHHEHMDSHSHKHVTHHDHHSEDSEETNPQSNHSHSFDMSVLALSLIEISSHHISFAALIVQIEQKIESNETNFSIRNFSSTVFRPPIV